MITERRSQAVSVLFFAPMSGSDSGLSRVLADMGELTLEPVVSTPAPAPRGKSTSGGGGGASVSLLCIVLLLPLQSLLGWDSTQTSAMASSAGVGHGVSA